MLFDRIYVSADNGCHFADDVFKCIFLNEKFGISIQISLKFVPKDRIDNKWAMVQVMAWHRTDDIYEALRGDKF